MRKFDYRAARFPVSLLVKVTFADSTWIGHCTEISTEGMRLESHERLSLDAFGAMQVTYDSVTLDLPIRVARCGDKCDGLRFLYVTEGKREEVARFIELLQKTPHNACAIQLR